MTTPTKSRYREVRTCLCGATFEVYKHESKKYCSLRCSAKANRCELGCTCKRHELGPKTQSHKDAISRAKKGVPSTYVQTPEQRLKNSQANLGNQRARGVKRSEEQKRKDADRMRQMWLDGLFDHKHPAWGKPGVHAGVNMRCLNSEGVFAQEMESVSIQWEYEPKRFKLSWCTYKPDFYLPEFDIWVEIKGYPEVPGEWREKVDTFRRETGKTLIVVFQEELPTLLYVEGGE